MEKLKLRNINSTLEAEYDIFICSASFEERCLSIPSKIRRKKIAKVILLENLKGSEKLHSNKEQIAEMFSKNVRCISLDFNDSLSMASNISKELSLEKRTARMSVLIDITTFTHEVLLLCLRLLRDNKKVKSITCVYNNASEYCPGVDVEKKWLSQGAELIHPILGFPGMNLPARKNHLIIIVGYEYSRAFKAISDIEPTSISLIYGTSNSSLTDKDKEANRVYKNLVEEMAFEYENIEENEIPCNNPDAIAVELERICDIHKDKNILILPLNNKMSTLGVFMFTEKHEEPQVCYAPAVLYNEANYSSPGNDCYIYKL